MQVLHARCAGLDVHKKMVVACVRIAGEDGRVERQVRTFDTTTGKLLQLHDWLLSQSVTHVLMESTGVYWKPVWHVLESNFELLLANAMHVKNVPGRKSDVNDATWLADLLAHGLIRPSFVPPTPIQELRDLMRTRKQLVRERASHQQRIDKVLQDANIKLDSVLSDTLGRSGRAILDAIVSGQSDPEQLVELVSKRVKATRQEMVEALRGYITPHHRFMLKLHLSQIDTLSKAITQIEEEAGERLAPFRQAAALLITIPGISDTAATVIVSEIGIDMSRFPSAAHLISWAGLCPRSDESAGKRRSTRIRKGAPWLKTLLIQCAWSAVRTKGSYLRGKFLRLRARRGAKKAIVAIAASILTAVYFMLKRGTTYQDLGDAHFSVRSRAKAASRLVRKLGELGYLVEIQAVSEGDEAGRHAADREDEAGDKAADKVDEVRLEAAGGRP
jgi:transposase